MSAQSDSLRAAAAFLLQQADELDGKPVPTGFVLTDKSTWWPAMKQQAIDNTKPHDWVDLAPGHVIGAGDNDTPDDDLLRVFRPFADAALQANQKDSTGERFSIVAIKKSAGIGPKGWQAVRDEIRTLWFTQWAVDWRNDSLNAPLVPKQADVDRIFAKVY